MPGSICRQNYAAECEAAINKQINMELYASYVYNSMAFYYERDDVALPGFAKYFKKSAQEESEHAQKFMAFQNKRGGRIVLKDIKKPERDEWGTGLDGMNAALELEKQVNQSIIDLSALAGEKGDNHLSHFLDDFLEEQVDGIKEIADHVTKLTRAGPGLGELLYDKDLA
jgi:ferritin heavy chain